MERSSPARAYVQSASTRLAYAKGKGSVRYLQKATQLFTPNAFSNILAVFQISMVVLFAFCTSFDAKIDAAKTGSSGQLDVVYSMFQDTHVMMLLGFGFLYTLLHRYSWSGVALNFVLTVLTIQWAIIAQGFWTDVSEYRRGHISTFVAFPLNIAALINADYTAATVLISFGAVIGRVSPTQLVVMALLEVVCSTANVIIGALDIGVNDPGGSMLIHVFGASFGLAVAYMIGDKAEHGSPRHRAKAKTSLSNGTFAMIGTLFLFAFWPSFNAALLTGPGQHRAVLNTVLAICCSAVTAFLLSRGIHEGKHLDMEHIQNATLAGGVAIGAACNMLLHPWGAMLTGIASGAVSAYGFTYLVPFFKKRNLTDFCGIMDLHLLPGLIGGVASAIAAASLDSTLPFSYVRFTPASLAENFPMWGGRSGLEQGALQLAVTGISLGFGLLSGALTGLVMTLPVFEPKTRLFYDDGAEWEMPPPTPQTLHTRSGIPATASAVSFSLPAPALGADASPILPASGMGAPATEKAAAGADAVRVRFAAQQGDAPPEAAPEAVGAPPGPTVSPDDAPIEIA